MNKCIDCEHGPCYTHMTNNNWEALLKRKTEYLMKAPCMIDEADLRSLANSFSELKDQEHKAELEMVAKKMKKKSRIQTTVGRDEDYEITVINLKDALAILDSHINKLIN